MKSLECQQNFVDLLESNVKSLFSIPESIRKYQDAISNTNVRINYAVGIGLYMIPSNLVLQVGVIQKYNNNLVIADDSTEIGENEDINPLDSAAAVNPGDSVEAVNPLDAAPAALKPKDSVEAVNPLFGFCSSSKACGFCNIFGFCTRTTLDSYISRRAVSYTHLTLPTKRIV